VGLWEWSHEVNAPYFKYFYLKVVVEGHCIPSCDVPLILALPAPPNEFFGVVIHGWPVESTLPDLGLCAEHSIMASIWCRMTFSRWFAILQLWVHISSIDHLNILGTDRGHPKGVVCFQLVAFSGPPLVVHNLQPCNSQCLHTMGWSPSPLAACRRVESHWLVVLAC
jgi:hypothetical protein